MLDSQSADDWLNLATEAESLRSQAQVKIAVAREYGSPDVVRVEEIETPTPEADEVLVRVKAASVNRADLDGIYPRWQFIRLFLGLRRPRLPGLGIDVAGTVESVGPEAKHASKSATTSSRTSFSYRKKGGAFAEFVCVPEKALSTMPAGLSARRGRHAAALGSAGDHGSQAARQQRSSAQAAR